MSSGVSAAAVDWVDEVGYDAHVRLRPEVLNIAVQDPTRAWSYLEPTFRSYQPFQGLQVKNKTGSLQKVEDLFADVVRMHYRDGAEAAPARPKRFSFGTAAINSAEAAAALARTRPSSPAIIHATPVPPSPSSLNHPMHWHSYPYLHLFICTTVSLDEYSRVVKPQIKRFMEYFVNDTSNASVHSSPHPPLSVPELRYHSEVLILYAPMMDETASVAMAAAAATASASSFSSLFRKSSSFGVGAPSSVAMLAEERAAHVKSSRKVYERLRSDFGGSSKDPSAGQTARIDLYEMMRNVDAGGAAVLDSSDLVHQWDEFVAKIVRSLIRTHEHRASLYEYELKQALANSHMPRWDYLAFFVVKESYARLHQQMGLKNDALRLYEELRVMMEDLLEPAPGEGGGRLQRLIDDTRAKTRDEQVEDRTAAAAATVIGGADAPAAATPSAIPDSPLSSMPGPILDTFSLDYPLLILRGELSELEFLRYLTAQCLWLMIRIHTSSVTTTATSMPVIGSNSYLCEVMRRGQDAILAIRRMVETSPDRYGISFARAFTWQLEAVMDLGVLCEKYLIHNYVATYQNLTSALLHQQQQQTQQQPTSSSSSASSIHSTPVRERSGFTNVLASAVAAVIGPSPTPTTSSLSASPALTPPPPVSYASGAAASLPQMTKALKAAHEADLRALQNMRGDLYGQLLEHLYQHGRSHAVHRLRGEIRDVLQRERSERAAGVTSEPAWPPPSSSPPLTDDLHPSLADAESRVGVDDDVYADMLAEYYPFEHGPDEEDLTPSDESNAESSAMTTRTMPTPMTGKTPYALFHARRKRILECFDAEEGGVVPAAAAPSSSSRFSALFLELCTCSLRMYWLSGRYRLCMRVAELKACIYYGLGSYTRALDLFLGNCDRWRRDRWTQLCFPTLLMAIKSYQRLARHDEVARACMLFLITAHQQVTSTKFRPVPLPSVAPADATPQQFTWSRLGAMVAAKRREEASTRNAHGANGTIAGLTSEADANKAASSNSSSAKTASPFLPYDIPALAHPTQSAAALAVATATVPPAVQILHLPHTRNDEAASAQSSVGDSSSPPAVASETWPCSTMMLDCCPDQQVRRTDATDIDIDDVTESGMVSPAAVQRLLLHTLRVHMPHGQMQLADADLERVFADLRTLAHRPASLSSLFDTADEGASDPRFRSPARKSRVSRLSTSGLALAQTPIVVPTAASSSDAARSRACSEEGNDADEEDEEDVSMPISPTATPPPEAPLPLSASFSSALPSGPYLESSLHPLFALVRPHLRIYRRTHPLHAVLEVEIESRLPTAVCIDAVGIVVSAERLAAPSHPSAPKKRQQRQTSVVVTAPPPPAPVATASTLSLNLSLAPLPSAIASLPSPLPSQSISASNSFQNLAALVQTDATTSAEPGSADSAHTGASVGVAAATPEPATSAPPVSSEPRVFITSPQTEFSPDPALPLADSFGLDADVSASEWSCVFRGVQLRPGTNRVCFHIFHSAPPTDPTDASAPPPQANTSESKLADDASTDDAHGVRHYSVTLRHSFAALEHLHALFEPSHAHLLRRGSDVDLRGRESVVFGGPSAREAASPAAVHSYWTTTLDVRDVWFGVGRLNMWHTDLRALNDALRTSVLTPAQRRKELRDDAGGRVEQANAAESSDLVDVDLVSPSDPHVVPGLSPPAPAFRPFSDKPRLTLDLLPVPPQALLLGKTAPFHIVAQIAVARPRRGRETRDVERCVLHVATDDALGLFGPTNKSTTATVHGMMIHDGVSSRVSFNVDERTGGITLGTLSGGARLLLLLPVRAPAHLAHLLRTKQIALPRSPAVTPSTSRAPSPATQTTSTPWRTPARRSSEDTNSTRDADGDDDSATDLHSVQHALHMDLTCAPVVSSSTAVSAGAPTTLPSFMFSSRHALTFMEPVQTRARIERLGRRWFLQVCAWNRCAYPLRVRAYRLDLPRGFVLRRDPNSDAVGHVMPPMQTPDRHCSETHLSGPMPGAAAAAAAATVAVSYASPNVLSLAFELAVDDAAPSATATTDPNPNGVCAQPHRDSLAPPMPDGEEEEALLAAAYASSAVGRCTIQVDTRLDDDDTDSSPPPPGHLLASSPTLLSLTWPIDVAIMSGAQDLHMMLAFPSEAHVGRLLTCTITVLRMRPNERKSRRSRTRTTDSGVAISSQSPAPLRLLSTLVAPPHLWLLAGKQTQSFDLAIGEQKCVTIQMMPIASGYLPIPHVDLHERHDDHSDASGAQPADTHVDPADSILAQASHALQHIEQAQREEAIQMPSIPAAHAVFRGDGFSSTLIPPARILRHFATNQQVRVHPPHTSEAQLQQVA